jgi:Na+-driven multidrug efflux pump
MSVNILVDTIFVGQWIGSLAIAAVTVLPITFFISSLGMARYRRWICSSRALGKTQVQPFVQMTLLC